MTETWLDVNFGDWELQLDEYNIFRRDRRGRGGGVYLPCIRRYDLEVDAEMVACQITTSASQHLLFSVFYRPPNAEEAFCEVLRIQPDLLLQVSTSRNQVKGILTKLDITKSTGVDGISARVLKECAEELSYPL